MYTVLVVDDSPYVVDVFVKMLERGRYRAIKAYSGQECLEMLKKAKTDMILLDIMMEPMDGWQTLKQIKKDPDTKNIPVLMITAKPLTYEEARVFGMDIEDYVLKPIFHQELFATIEQVLQRRRAIKEATNAAKRAGFSQAQLEEYARLCKSVDVDKRLLQILETTYRSRDSDREKISNEIHNMQVSIKTQQERLQHIRQEVDRLLKQ
jgi:CheY-like chemotaxis protein